MHKLISRFVLPAGITLAGVACTGIVIALSADAERTEPAPRVETVEVVEAIPGDLPAVIHTTGAAVPARQVVLSSEVSGRVVSTSLRPGARLAAGEAVLQVDPRDYRLAVAQEQSRLSASELERDLERGRGEIAGREWELLGSSGQADASLALRVPQLAVAEGNVEAAAAGLERARLSLERTTLRAPFNAVVVSESAEVGQVLQPGASVATLVGTDQLWIEVSVPVDRLAALEVPGIRGATTGSTATVTQQLARGERIVRQGDVLGLVGQLDPATRTATLLVGVDDPMGDSSEALPMLPGAFVDVDLHGAVMASVIQVPRASLEDGEYLWVVAEGETLTRRQVEVAWRTPEHVVVASGLDRGDRVVSSPMSLPVEGMPVSVRPSATADAGR